MNNEQKPNRFVQELIEHIDGPGPDVVNDLSSNHLVGATCAHCQTIIAEPAGKVPMPVIPIKVKKNP